MVTSAAAVPGNPDGPLVASNVGSAATEALCQRPGAPTPTQVQTTAELPGRSRFNRQLAVGDPSPTFESLPGIDGLQHSFAEWRDRDILVLMFLRSLCPSTHAHEERLRTFARDYADRSVALVAISVSRNPAEDLDKMTHRAVKQKYLWSWLCDLSQATARNYGASVTPQFFVLDRQRRVAYMGAFDNDPTGRKVTKTYVADAVSALLEGKQPPIPETLPKGCEIELFDRPAPPDRSR